MSMYRREHAGFDYELWLRRGHTGTPDDFLEWLRGGNGGGSGNVDIDSLTESAKAELSAYWLPIANERHYGSIKWSDARNIQGMCSFYGNDKKDYVVFATQHGNTNTKMHRYCVNDDDGTEKPYMIEATVTDEEKSGHYNDMTYCTEDGRIYVANYTHPRIEVFNTALEWEGYIDMSGFGNPSSDTHGCVHSIAWSEKEKCFYVGFLDITGNAPTSGLFRFPYNATAPFSEYTQIAVDYSNYNRQCLHVDSKTGNIIQVKFRNVSSFNFPHGNRAHVYSTEGELIAVTYLDSIYEIEGICELSDGLYFVGYAANGTTLDGGALYSTIFTRAALRSSQNASLLSTWSKVHLNTSDFVARTNNVYYNEGGDGIKENGGDPTAETPGKPFKTWPAIYNGLRSNHTKQLNVNLLSDMTWAVSLGHYPGTINFVGVGSKWGIPVEELVACRQSVLFTNVKVYTNESTTWTDNNIIHFSECDLTNVGTVDLLRTRIVRLDQPMPYGAATRFAGVGTSFRIYGDTTEEEQYAIRGGTSAAANIACSALTRISQIRTNMNMNVSTVTAGKMTDIPFWLRNGDWDNGKATCSTAGDVAEKAITVADISALTNGLAFLIKFTHANTYDGDLTLNLNGLGAVPLLFGDWADGEQVCVKYYAPDPVAGTAARFVRYGLSFTGRAEVLGNSAMLYTIQHGGEEYRRVVEFGKVSSEDTRELRIISDSGWQTRDDEIYPINTVVRPEAMARNWVGKKVVVFGDSITNWSHGGYWTNYLISEAGCTVTNRSVSGAGFARGVNTIIGQLGTKATVTEAGLTATALYGGLWGNGLTYTIAEADDTFTVTVSLDGQVVLTYTGLATIGDLKTASSGNGYLTFDGTDATALTAGESIALAGAELVESGLFNGAAAVIVAAGTNDANSTETAVSIRAAIQTVIDTVKANTTAPIIFITPIRRSHDSSGGTGTETYSRQRLVGAAICNVAVLNDCSVVNGYDFPIATTGTEWVTDMTLDGLHPEAAGKDVYAHSFLSAVGYEYKNTIKILGIGNSHTRDALYYLYEILAHAGYNATVGHYYWGGSSLEYQYNALIHKAKPNTDPVEYYEFPTDREDYYRKFDRNGTGKYHKHYDDYDHKLDYALTDEEWDVVVFQNNSAHSIDYDNFFNADFSINDFVAEVKTRIGNPNLLIGIAPPPPRPRDFVETQGAKSDSNPMGGVTSLVGLTPSQTAQMTQDVLYRVANDMSQCDFIINTAKGITLARTNTYLDALGNDMMRAARTTNEHLCEGIPFFLSAMVYAMTICGDEVGFSSWYPDPGAYSTSAKYQKGNVTLYNGTVYRCVTAPPVPAGEFDAQYWEEYNQAELAYLAKQYARNAAFPGDVDEIVPKEASGAVVTIDDGVNDRPVVSLITEIDGGQAGVSTVNLLHTKKNLLVRPYVHEEADTNRGITFVVQDDGTVTASGTLSGTDQPYNDLKRIWLQPGVVYSISHGCDHPRAFCVAYFRNYANTQNITPNGYDVDNGRAISQNYISTLNNQAFRAKRSFYVNEHCVIEFQIRFSPAAEEQTITDVVFKPMIYIGGEGVDWDVAPVWQQPVGEMKTISLPAAVTEGELNVTTGELTVTQPEAAVYQLTPTEITTLAGFNQIISDTGDVRLKYWGAAQAYPPNVTVELQDERRFVRSSGIYLRPGLMHGYSDANDLPANQIFDVFSNVTASNMANLPVYGEIAYILTLTYDATVSYSMQIYMGESTFATRIKAINGWRGWTIYTKKSAYDALEARVAALEGS